MAVPKRKQKLKPTGVAAVGRAKKKALDDNALTARPHGGRKAGSGGPLSEIVRKRKKAKAKKPFRKGAKRQTKRAAPKR